MSLRRRSVNVDVPVHVSSRFEKQFRHLVDHLSKERMGGSYLREEVFSKYLDPRLVTPKVRATAAVRKWMDAEARNSMTNQRLLEAEMGCGGDFGWTTHDKFVRRVRRIISSVLGPLRYPEILMGSWFTNGASTRVRRGPAAAVTKLTGELHITDSALKHWFAMATTSKLSPQALAVVPSSVLFTVPKKTEIDRVACKEPEGNALLQRAVGLHISKRLLKVGIDLRDQTNNQRLASVAWADGLATIDLSSASDTISRGIVSLLLPFEWWHLLDDLRVHSTVLPDGSTHALEMFSSMGNGFTFELETLIFYAMAKAVAQITRVRGAQISVYGDDIIVPVTMARRLMRVMHFYGFLPNAKKTHVTGPFRESCGRHYWKGRDVSPFYYRKAIATLPEMINILNRLLEWDGRGFGAFFTESAYRFWLRWKDYIPKFLWGGIHHDDPTCLVTGDPPRKRLVPITKDVRFCQSAGMITWLHRRDTSVGVEPMEVDPADVVGFRAATVVSAGERTAWEPGLFYSTL